MTFNYSTFSINKLILNILLIPNRLGIKIITYFIKNLKMNYCSLKSSNFKFIFATHFYNDVFLKNIFGRFPVNTKNKNKMIIINNLYKIIMIIRCAIIYIKLINNRFLDEHEFKNV